MSPARLCPWSGIRRSPCASMPVVGHTPLPLRVYARGRAYAALVRTKGGSGCLGRETTYGLRHLPRFLCSCADEGCGGLAETGFFGREHAGGCRAARAHDIFLEDGGVLSLQKFRGA